MFGPGQTGQVLSLQHVVRVGALASAGFFAKRTTPRPEAIRVAAYRMNPRRVLSEGVACGSFVFTVASFVVLG